MRLVHRDRSHMSLDAIGCYPILPREIVDCAIAAAAGVEMPSFVIGLNRIACWKAGEGRSTVVLTGDEGRADAILLRKKIREAVASRGLPCGPDRFNPHVTLMRGRAARPDEIVETIRWHVSEFVLIHSLVGESRHEVLARWPLQTVH